MQPPSMDSLDLAIRLLRDLVSSTLPSTATEVYGIICGFKRSSNDWLLYLIIMYEFILLFLLFGQAQ